MTSVWKPGTPNSDDWVRSTRTLPVAFAQVREDPLIELRLLEKLGRDARVLMIASGGETAAVLAAQPIRQLHLVDVNPAQIGLTRLKLGMLRDATSPQRLALLGHLEMESDERDDELQRRLAGLELAVDELGPRALIAELGPDYCGRYEWLFARLRELLSDVESDVLELMLLSDVAEQSKRVAANTDPGRRLEQAFAETMELSVLQTLFGPDATANRILPFAEHFLRQTRWALATFAAETNPFLHQIFLGRFPGPSWPWLTLPKHANLCRLKFFCGTMISVLSSRPDKDYDLIHLSNILDWIKPSEAAMLLDQAYRCLSPGGIVVIRQLNSALDISAVPSGFHWMQDLARQLHHSDRSYFYRALYVGIRS
jgi:S-adenosylmethionine-diacylglycerol 3-amino-3-carboxypropyl transferase